MSDNFKTDQSFFTYVKIPVSSYLGLEPIKQWFRDQPFARYRLIADAELDVDYANLKTIDDMYPETKTFAVVMNPWSRAVLSYTNLKEKEETNRIFKLENFESYLLQISSELSLRDIQPNAWYDFNTQQKQWIEYIQEDGTVRSADYIIKLENLEEDFKAIKDYFLTDDAIKIADWYVKQIPDYKNFYNEKTKNLIADIFKEDIEQFNYKF